MNTKMIVATVSIGCALLTGCLQTQLQSNNEQERMSALAQLSDNDLENVILGRPLEDGASPYYKPRGEISYSDDVKMGAIDRLYEKGKIEKLIDLADDHRTGGGKMEMVYGETPTTKAIKSKLKLTSPDGWNNLLTLWKKEGSYSARKMFRKLWGETDDAFYVWIASQEDRKAMNEIFQPSSGDIGKECVERIKHSDSLLALIKNKQCPLYTRLWAEDKIFKRNDVSPNEILAIVASFEGCKDVQIGGIVADGIGCAKRIGAKAVVATLEAKYSTDLAQKETEKRKEVFWKNIGEIQSFFVANRKQASKGDIFRIADSLDLATAWAPEYASCNCTPVVKQVVNDGVVVGCIKEYQNVRTGTNVRINGPGRPVYSEFRFPNRIFVKTNKSFADGDVFDIKYLKYLGTTTYKSMNGSNVTFHTFEPYQIPDDMK